jgi:hypothetical protein
VSDWTGVGFLVVQSVSDVAGCYFFTEKLTEVLILSFLKTKVSFVMQIETHGLKNKVSKTQGPKMCLTLKFILFGWTYIFKIKRL